MVMAFIFIEKDKNQVQLIQDKREYCVHTSEESNQLKSKQQACKNPEILLLPQHPVLDRRNRMPNIYEISYTRTPRIEPMAFCEIA